MGGYASVGRLRASGKRFTLLAISQIRRFSSDDHSALDRKAGELIAGWKRFAPKGRAAHYTVHYTEFAKTGFGLYWRPGAVCANCLYYQGLSRLIR